MKLIMILLTSVSEIVAPKLTLSKLWILNLINFPVINPVAWLANRMNRLIGHSFHNRTAYRLIRHFDIWFINRRNSIFRFIFNFTTFFEISKNENFQIFDFEKFYQCTKCKSFYSKSDTESRENSVRYDIYSVGKITLKQHLET